MRHIFDILGDDHRCRDTSPDTVHGGRDTSWQELRARDHQAVAAQDEQCRERMVRIPPGFLSC